MKRPCFIERWNEVFFASEMTLKAHIFFHFFFFLFLFFFLFSSFLSFFLGNGDRKWEREKSYFYPRFPFFLFLFSLLFSIFSYSGVGNGEWNFRYLFPLFFFFGEKMERSNWKNWRKFVFFFLLNFSIFSFFWSFSFSVFPSFLGGGMEGEKDRGNCLLEDKRNLQEHSIFFKCVFGKKNTPKIHILCQKHDQKCQKSDFFRQKYFLAKSSQIFGRIFGEFQGGLFNESKKF